MLTKYQNENREILRSQITMADYNPRKISKEAIKKLKRNIKARGLMGGLAWNETTGNLISGHQRLGIIDQLMKYDGSPESDYKIKVDVARLSAKDEKEQNIFMNGRASQGEWDFDLLKDLVTDLDIDMLGLTEIDLEMLNMGADMDEPEPLEKSSKPLDDREPSDLDIDDREDSFFTVHFDDFLSKAEFLDKLGFEVHMSALDGDDLKEAIERRIKGE